MLTKTQNNTRVDEICGRINAMVNADAFDRRPRVLDDGATLSLGTHSVRWLDAPHLPHAWECGYLFEARTNTLLCGALDYYAHARNTRALLERLAGEKPTTLACMHGSAWTGDGAALLRALADRLAMS